jgi:hypothetical protein
MVPVPDDANQLTTWRKNDVNAQKILIDFVKNNLVSHLSKSEIDKEMFHSLKKLFE